MEIGKFAIRPGPMMAGGAMFDIHITGVGAHGARPESGVDPVVIASQIVMAAQTIVSRNIRPRDTAVVSITQIHAGDAYNVIPQTAQIMGTARAFSMEVLAMIEDNLRRLAENIAAGFGATAKLDFRLEFMPTVNNDAETQFAIECAAELVGAERVNGDIPMIMASEDFSYMLNERPGAYIMVGNGAGEGGCEVHNPAYDFNDQAIPYGAAFFATAVEKKLARR
jgi:hippurate hydrolase